MEGEEEEVDLKEEEAVELMVWVYSGVEEGQMEVC